MPLARQTKQCYVAVIKIKIGTPRTDHRSPFHDLELTAGRREPDLYDLAHVAGW